MKFLKNVFVWFQKQAGHGGTVLVLGKVRQEESTFKTGLAP